MILSAKNYRRAASSAMGYIEIDLRGPLTVIVGDNATGKTTLLDAVHLAVFGQDAAGGDAVGGRLVAGMSNHALGSVRAMLGGDFQFHREYDGQTLKRGVHERPGRPVGLPVRATTTA